MMDPPYYDNVMYAELSDFFYVWLKRTAGHVFPELFRRQLTDKDNEAVANPAKFRGQKGARALAGRDYQQRMAAIFAECRRVLKPDGIMTLMFTHKATVRVGRAHHRPDGRRVRDHGVVADQYGGRRQPAHPGQGSSQQYDLSGVPPATGPSTRAKAPTTGKTWSRRSPGLCASVSRSSRTPGSAGWISSWRRSGRRSRSSPATGRYGGANHGTGTPERRGQQKLLEEAWDAYAVSPEDALDVARREVKRWRLERLTHLKAKR